MRPLRIVPLLLLLSVPLQAQAPDLAAGDAAWARRAEGQHGGHAAPGPIGEAIAAYERAYKAQPANLEAAWKLLRALHFQGDFVATSQNDKQRIFGRGRDVFEAALNEVERRAGGRAKLDDLAPPAAAKAVAGIPEAKPIFLWGAVHWGLWGDAFGRLAAARQGVGDKVRRNAEILLALDERYEDAAAHRVLGRLHTLAPKVPFFTGWVDRGQAVSHLRRAVALAPDSLLNRLYLADALLQHQPDKAAEARQILKRMIESRPGPARQVEDERAIADARALLAKSAS
jgi:tetratricopeptide (TPR) repeat protein